MRSWKFLTSSLKYFSLFVIILGIGADLAQARAIQPAPFTQKVERCIIPAAQFHHVNPYILRAILRVESRLQPDTLVYNTNGSYDIGIGGYNSVNFKEIAKFGIAPEHMLDACIATYVSAWHLRKKLTQYGHTWFGIAAYHSVTSHHNHRYQVLLYNELIKSGAIQGDLQPVPSLR